MGDAFKKLSSAASRGVTIASGAAFDATPPVALASGAPVHRPRFALTMTALLVVALGSCTAENQLGGGPGGTTGAAATPATGDSHPSPIPGVAYAPATGSGPPSKLINMPAPQVVAMLGEPGFKREENPAQVWRYTGKACVLELFLYRLDKDFQVRHVETRDAKANAVPADPCIAAIAAQKKIVASK